MMPEANASGICFEIKSWTKYIIEWKVVEEKREIICFCLTNFCGIL